MTTLELTNVEAALLAEILEIAHTQKLRELHHTDARALRMALKCDVETLERLKDKLSVGIDAID